MIPDPALATRLRALAHRLADAAAAETLPRFRDPSLAAPSKSAAEYDPVTEADRAAERAMRALLTAERPEDAVAGEELDDSAGASGLQWVLDPIDGTRAYLAGAPTWGTLIAVGPTGRPLYGVIDQPHTGERFEGGFGHAALHRAGVVRSLATRPARPLGDAILMSTFPEIGTAAEWRAFASLAAEVRLVRYGLDCYAYALLALGMIDLVVEAGLKAVDIAAPIAVIKAAGGCVTDWTGGPAAAGGRAVAAANREIHAAALAHLAAAGTA